MNAAGQHRSVTEPAGMASPEILSKLDAEAEERNVPSLQTVEITVGGREAQAHGLQVLKWLIRH